MNFDFTNETKPTIEQVRFVWNSMVKPSARKVAAEMEKRGAKISFKTVARWKRDGWIVTSRSGENNAPLLKKHEQANSKVNNAIRALVVQMPPEEKAMAIGETQQEAKLEIGGPMTPKELSAIEKDLKELSAYDVPALKAMQEKDRLIYNIMLLRQSQRKADILALIPKDSAALMVAASDAQDALPNVPTGILPSVGNGHMIDVTPNPQNELASAIDMFLKKEGVAA